MLRPSLASGLLLAAALPLGAQTFQFDDRSAASGLFAPPGSGSPAIGVGDYDGDGWLDVVLAAEAPPVLYRNNGDGVRAGLSLRPFVDVSDQVLPAGRPHAAMAMLADLDDDGDPDLVTVRMHQDGFGTWLPIDTSVEHHRNDGGVFGPGAGPPDLGRQLKGHGGLALADLDGDRDLDVVFAHRGSGSISGSHGRGFYLRNDGLPHFSDVTAALAPGLLATRRHFSLVLADFTGDLRPDLHCAVDFFSDFHAHNQGGALVDVTQAVNATHGGADMGLAVGDIENDGDLDVYSTNIAEGVLYVNDGAGVFSDEAQQRGVGGWSSTSTGWGTAFVDFDHDGDLDLVFTGNHAPGLLFENDGTGHFQEVAGHGLALSGHGLIPFDYDRDGDQDLLVFGGAGQPPRLYANVTPAAATNHRLTVRLRGSASNADGVGARLRLRTGSLVQTRHILAGYSYKSGPPMEAHFGLGAAAVADELRIEWPSGTVQVLTGVAADRTLLVQEP